MCVDIEKPPSLSGIRYSTPKLAVKSGARDMRRPDQSCVWPTLRNVFSGLLFTFVPTNLGSTPTPVALGKSPYRACSQVAPPRSVRFSRGDASKLPSIPLILDVGALPKIVSTRAHCAGLGSWSHVGSRAVSETWRFL